MKLIATDLDGTLLQKDQTISIEDLDAINKAEKEGIKVIVATGRQYVTAKKLLKKCNFEPDYMICDNGSSIYSVQDDNKLCSFPLHKSTVSEVLDYLEDNKYCYSLSTDTCRIELDNYIERLTNEFKRNKERIPDLDPLHLHSLVDLIKTEQKDGLSGIKGPKDIINLNMNFYNITALSFDPERIQNGISGASTIPGISVVSSAYNNFEMLNKDSSKGNALEFIADYLNISLNDTMAIGDNFNDLSMFEKAFHSVAMGNSNDEIKKLCRYVSINNADSGVGYAINNFALK